AVVVWELSWPERSIANQSTSNGLCLLEPFDSVLPPPVSVQDNSGLTTTMAPMLQPTSVPALHTSRIALGGTTPERKLISSSRDIEWGGWEDEHFIEVFCRFIWLLLGGTQEEICFLVQRDSSLIAASSSLLERSSIKLNSIDEPHQVPSEYSIHLKTSPNRPNWEAGHLPTSKLIAEISPCDDALRICINADAGLVPVEALESLLDLLSHLILDDGRDFTQPAVLNYPPQDRPLPFLQEPQNAVHPALLHGGFERRAQQFPDRDAIDFLARDQTRQRYTYQDVDTIADQIASKLPRVGVHGRRPVVIAMGPSPEMYISYLAVLKSGHHFCPLPIDAPVERQWIRLDDLKCCAILTRSSDLTLPLFAEDQAEQLTARGITITNTSEFLQSRHRNAGQNGDSFISSAGTSEDDLAYIMYTSGTTGKPKGVQISHLSVACLVAADCAVAPLSMQEPPTRWFQFAAPTFDPSIFEIFSTLSSGGTLCCAERDLTLDDVNTVLAQMEVDAMMTTPSMASLVDPTYLKALVAMGEALNPKVIGAFSVHNPHDQSKWQPSDGPLGLYNGYGPTETTINCTMLTHRRRYRPPLPSCSLVIVDESDPYRPLPWGCIGELLIAGPQVSSRGYLNRPEENAKGFLPSSPWGRAYRTGDRARVVWDSKSGSGVVEFLGRISSDQVKLSGRRVELGEVDAVIMSAPDVREALSFVHKPNGTDVSGSEKLLTAVSLTDIGAQWETVKAHIEDVVQRELPPFMRPFRLFPVPQLPRSAAGKLDRKALNGLTQELPAHLSEVEEKLLSVLGEILQTRPAPETNLVAELGLDSLRAMQFLSRVRAMNIAEGISLQELLSGASIRTLLAQKSSENGNGEGQLASKLFEFSKRHHHAASQLAGLQAADVDEVLPATATQSGMIASLIRSSQGAQKTYINHSCYYLTPGKVDIDRLINATECIILEREAYRTTFVPIDDTLAPFAQCIISRKAAAKDRETWCQVFRRSGTNTEDYWLEKAEEEISLEQNILYRIQLINGRTLIFSLFHGIFDGGSLELLLVDIERKYRGLAPEPRTDISLAAKSHFDARSQATDDFWLRETADYQAESIPALSGSKPRHFKASTQDDTCVLQRTTSMTYAELQASSRNIGASPLAVWQTAWALLLSTFSESQTGDVMFGSLISNRFDADIAVCHGPTFSMLPCRVRLPDESDQKTTVAKLAAQIAHNGMRSLAHPHPALGLVTTAEGKLPFDSLLALQHFEMNGDADTETESLWDRISLPAMRNDFGAMLEVWPYDPCTPRALWKSGSPMKIKITFKTDLLTEKVAARILAQVTAIASSILNNPEQIPAGCLSSIPRSLMSLENPTPLRLEAGATLLHSQFEHFAETHPGRVALAFKHSLAEPSLELTYQELNTKADFLARRIQHHFEGQAPIDMVIPICLEKSPELYIAVLGILKAGAAWCPIDIAFPAQRRLELIKRTKSSLLVASKATEHLVDECLPEGTRAILVDLVTPDTEPLHSMIHVPLQPDHLAYLIWTSGTTGAPKGVMIEHSAAVQAMVALQKSIPTSYDVASGQPTIPRVLNFCSYSFDVFVEDLFYTWGLGGTLVSSTREIMLGSFTQLVVDMKATHAHLTPSFGASVRRKDLGDTLQVVTMIGEKLTERVANDWSWHTKSFNTYGPAENAVVSTLRQFSNETEDEAKAANVGWSLPSVSSFVVTPEAPHRLVPFNGVGELALGGYQLARGYLDDPVKTSARFVWSDTLQQRIYLTGDTVRTVDHGTEFLGRNDDLVKLNGIRVELSEISATCAGAHEDVEHIETFLLARPDRPTKSVVSFASLRDNAADAPLVATDKRASTIREKILATAHQLLPDYMVPSFLILLNQMPRTASNKVDRKVLQSVYESIDLTCFDTAAPTSSDGREEAKGKERLRTSIEEQVVEIMSSLAGVDANIILDNMSLARLGIHSISAIRLAWRLKKEANVDIAVVDMFRCSTVGQLLDLVSSAESRSVRVQRQQEASEWLDDIEQQLLERFAVRLQSQESVSTPAMKAIRPATAMQESLVVESLRNSRSYWSHRMFRLNGVELDRLRVAWELVAGSNEILRTSFFVPAEVDDDAVAWLKSVGNESAVLQAVAKSSSVRWSSKTWDSNSQDLATAADDAAQMARNEATPLASARLTSPWSITILADQSTDETVMMLSIHHSLHDAWAMQSILDDVYQHYCTRSDQVPNRTQFGRALRSGLYPTGEQISKSKKFMHDMCDGLVEDLGPVLNTKLPDLTASRHALKRCILRTSSQISPADETGLWNRLQTTTRTHNLGSPMHFITAAFGSVLAQYLESRYVVLGETIDQRILDPQLQTVIGPMIATIPRAVRIDASLSNILSSKANSSSEELSHIRPSALRKLLGINSELPLWPALIVFNPATDGEGEEASVQFWDEMEDLVGLCVEHPLALNIFEHQANQGLTFELSGDNQVICKEQLQMLLDQVFAQLDAMLAHPDLPLEELNNQLPRSLLAVTEMESTSIRDLERLDRDASWAGITSPAVNPVAWVEYHARHHPNWIAVEEIVDLDEPELTRRWTYAELLANASQVLEMLQTHEIPKGSVVGLHLGRTLESFAAIIALFRGEYIYLPLDEELPPERTHMLAAEAELEADEPISLIRNLGVILLDDPFDDPSSLPNLPAYTGDKDSTQDGYILFTSGSTGKPKGVRVTNSNLCSFIEAFARRILDNSPETANLAGTGKYLNLASRAFDPHLTHMFMAWRLGLAATIGPRMMMLGNLESVIVQNGITHFGTVPSVLQQARLGPAKVPNVVFVTVGGEKVSNDVLGMWTEDEAYSPLMMNVYGPTECTIGCTSNIVDSASNARNIGRVFDSAVAIIFAREDSDSGAQIIAKRGQTGELCIAGDLVSLGYLDRPEAQAKAFGTTELLGQPKRFYRTGDLVRMMANGCIEYLGRSDNQAKVNGQRLELGEVEHFLRWTAEEMQVKLDFAAAVIQHPSLPRPRLFTFVTQSGSERSDVNLSIVLPDTGLSMKLSDACARSLPAFMVPDLVWVNRIPYLRASEKVDQKQLKALIEKTPLYLLQNDNSSDDEGEDSQSLTADEELVIQAVERTIGAQLDGAPTPDRSIYELGIDSLSAVHLSAHLKRLDFQVTVADVLSHPTIRSLADYHSTPELAADSASMQQKGTQKVELFATTHRDEIVNKLGKAAAALELILPTMPLQSSLLARSLAQVEDYDTVLSPGTLYVTQLRYGLDRSTDLYRYISAVEQVLREEQMLRTCFYQTNTGEMAQIVLSEVAMGDLVSTVHSSWSEWQASGSLNAIARELIQNMSNLPPIRIHIFHSEATEVLVSLHHSLFDGDAIRQIRSRIQECYDRNSDTKKSPDSLKQLVAQLESVDTVESRTFWQDNLANATPCLINDPEKLVTAEPSNVARSTQRLSVPLPELRSVAQANNISLNALFQTVFALLLSELVPQHPEVIFGSVLSLRPLLASSVDDVDHLIAPCLNTLPQRVRLSLAAQNAGSLSGLAQQVRENLSKTMTHAFVPVDQIMKWSRCEHALFEAVISVNVHSDEDSGSSETRPGTMTLIETISTANVPFAADVNVYSDRGYVEVDISSNSANAGLSDIPKIAGRFAELCALFVQRPEMRLSELLPSLPAPSLPSARNNDNEEDAPDSSPWSSTESLLREVISDILQVPADQLTKRTSFYRLGLDSILVLRLARLVRDKFGVKLSPVAILRARCIEAVAKLVDGPSQRIVQQLEPNAYTQTIHRLAQSLPKTADVECFYLATPMQQGMLSAGLSDTTQPSQTRTPYVYQHTFELGKPSHLDLSTLQSAWSQVVQQVEILRTTFHFTGDSEQPWLGVVRHTVDDTIRVFQSIAEAKEAPVHVDVANHLAQCAVVMTASEPVLLTFTMHHASYDATSLPLLWRTFQEACRTQAKSTRMPAKFSPLAEQIAVQQPSAVNYWAKQLRGYIYEQMVLDKDEQNPRRVRSTINIPPQQLEAVQASCRGLGVTLQAALLLAWSKCLAANVLRQSDVVFGQVLSGRSLEGADSVIGPTLNTVAMRVPLSADLSNAQALLKVQTLSEQAQQHQVASLRKVQSTWRSSTESAAANLFESLFVYNGETGGTASSDASFWHRTSLRTAGEDDGFTDYPLVGTVDVSGAGLHLRIHASSAHLDTQAVQDFAEAFDLQLKELLSSPDSSSVSPSLPLQRKHSTGSDPTGRANGINSEAKISEADQQLCKIVVDAAHALLDKGPIDADRNLFQVGLDSILAIRLSSKLRRSEMPLAVNEIMQGKTIANMVSRKRQVPQRKHQKSTSTKPRPTLLDNKQEAAAIRALGWTSSQVESVLPCLSGQEEHLAYWIHAGHRFFEAPWIYKLKTTPAMPDIQRAWDELRRRHAILRSSFVAMDCGGNGQAVQVTQIPTCVDSRTDGTFVVVQNGGAKTLDEAVVQHLLETNGQPSNLLSSPISLTVLAAAHGECACVIRLHHAMYDAWSIRLLIKDLDRLLAGHVIPPDPLNLPRIIKDVLAQRDQDGEQSFWSQALRSAQATILTPKTAAANMGPLGPQHLVRLPSMVPATAVQSLDLLAQKKASSSLSSAILFAFATTLSKSFDSALTCPTFGFYHASRSIGSLDLTQVAVPTLSLTPLCVELVGTEAVPERIQALQNVLGQVTQYCQAPMRDILAHKDPNQPLFNAYINLLYRNSGEEASPMEVLERLRPSTNTYFTDTEAAGPETAPTLKGLETKHIAPLRIFVDVVIDKTADGISFGIRCDSGLYDVEHVQEFAERFVKEMEGVKKVLEEAS
ncbi:Nonribosomal peptide synthetase sidC, partial [Pseudocercospora fuligena]